jgi:hypothetical protein
MAVVVEAVDIVASKAADIVASTAVSMAVVSMAAETAEIIVVMVSADDIKAEVTTDVTAVEAAGIINKLTPKLKNWHWLQWMMRWLKSPQVKWKKFSLSP